MADRDERTTRRAGTRVSPLGQERSGLRVRLVRRASNAAGGEPFVRLREGPGSRTWLAEIVTDAGVALQRFAWKVRVDDAAPAAGAEARSAAEIDDAWRRERDTLARLRSPHVVAPFPVPDGMESSWPVAFCARTDRWFPPVSPRTGQPLTTGGDAGEGASAGPGLVEGWAALVHGDHDDAIVDQAAQWLPCIDCQHRRECYQPTGPGRPPAAVAELHFLSARDVEAIAYEHHDLDWNDACSLLGGADAAAVLATKSVVADSGLLPRLQADGQWLFAVGSQRAPLERLRQKLRLFRELCLGTAAVHALGRPHLGVLPANVGVALSTGAAGPVRWQLQSRLGGLGSALPVPLPGGIAGTGFQLGAFYEPAPEVRADVQNQPFLPPGLRAGEGAAMTSPVACWRTGSPDGLVRFVVEVQAAVGRSCRTGDLMVVRATTGGASLVARIDEVRPRGLLASAMLPPNDAWLQNDGKQLVAELVFHRRLGPAADFGALGAMLVRAVLVDDRQTLDEAMAAMAKVLRSLADEPTGVRMQTRTAAACLRGLLQAKDLRARVDSSHVLYAAADRAAHEAAHAAGTPAIPTGIWYEVLTIALRLLATGSPFAYVGSLADGATTSMQDLLADLEAVTAALDVELFHREARDVAVAAACAEVLEELDDAPAAAAAAGQQSGFRLLLERDGDKKTQEFEYTVDRVTIGRREGDNLLRLQDPMVSSNHAVIEADGDGFVVLDRNSTNGTEVDGIRLPVEVPQPLVDGSVIRIRPFQLVFRERRASQDPGLATAELGAASLHEQMTAAFAAMHEAPAAAVHEALHVVLRRARETLGGTVLRALLQDARLSGRGAGLGSGGGALPEAKARALQQLARSLVGAADFATVDQVQQFAGNLGRFVEAVSQWIERTLELKKVLGKHLEFGVAATATGRAPVRSAAEVRVLALGATGDAAQEPAAAQVARFFESFTEVVAGLLRGNQKVRAAVRERLDPARLVAEVAQQSGPRAAAATTSELWQAYVVAFQELTGGVAADAELEALLQRVLPERPR